MCGEVPSPCPGPVSGPGRGTGNDRPLPRVPERAEQAAGWARLEPSWKGGCPHSPDCTGGTQSLPGDSAIEVRTCLQMDRGLEGLQQGSRGPGRALAPLGSPVCADVPKRSLSPSRQALEEEPVLRPLALVILMWKITSHPRSRLCCLWAPPRTLTLVQLKQHTPSVLFFKKKLFILYRSTVD